MTDTVVRPKNESKNEKVEDRRDAESDRVALPRRRGRRYGAALLGGTALLLLVGGLAGGAWGHYRAELGVAATAQQSMAFVPNVRVPRYVLRQHDNRHVAGDDNGVEVANIFARTNGYKKRYVDIGDQVKAEICRPTLSP
jgi:hypothetical protein